MLAADYADKNVRYTAWSTAIKAAQESRNLSKSLGQTQADVAGAGFAVGRTKASPARPALSDAEGE
jgi:hypothetical protein